MLCHKTKREKQATKKKKKKRFRVKTPPGMFLASLSPSWLIPLDSLREVVELGYRQLLFHLFFSSLGLETTTTNIRMLNIACLLYLYFYIFRTYVFNSK